MDKVTKMIWELYEKGEIDILTARYYSRLITLADNAILTGKRKIDLKQIGETLIEHVSKKQKF